MRFLMFSLQLATVNIQQAFRLSEIAIEFQLQIKVLLMAALLSGINCPARVPELTALNVLLSSCLGGISAVT